MASPPASSLLRYTEVLPSPPLAESVQCYWALEGVAPPGGTTRVLPDGCVDILVDLTPHGRGLRAVGAMRTASVVPLQGTVSVLGVRFRPGGAVPFLRLRMDALTDLDATLEAMGCQQGARLKPRLAEAATLAARIRILEEWLLARLDPRHRPDATVAHAVGLILGAGGALPVRTVREAVGLSERTLERRFLASVGVGPKLLCRVARLQRVVNAAHRAPAPDWAQLALEQGYCDQAHLVREFRELAGVTPGAWAREQGRVGSVQDSESAHP